MMKIIFFILILISILSNFMLLAESTNEENFTREDQAYVRNFNKLIISAGIGNGLLNDDKSHNVNMAYNIRILYKWKSTFLSAHYLRYDRYQYSFNYIIDYESEDIYITDVSLLMGHCFYLSSWYSNYIAISLGIGLVGKRVYSFQEEKKSYTAGIPIGLEFSQRIFRNIGGCIYVFGNYNSLESYIGILYNVQLWF